MELALGTAQFGLKYGIAGRGEAVPSDEVRIILKAAAHRGVHILDTAAAYGNIEQHLTDLCGDLPFAVISKIPAVPAEQKPVDWALASAQESCRRIGKRLCGLMFHNPGDLSGEQGQDVWQTLRTWTQAEGIKLGVSCYTPDDYVKLQMQLDMDLTQLPGNALDQRVQTIQKSKCEVHLRSAFLQGLMLLPLSVAQKRLPPAAPALERWHKWYEGKGLDPLQAALSIVKGFTAVSTVVVGVDNLAQFEGIAEAWDKAEPLHAPQLNEENLEIIDPRRWRA